MSPARLALAPREAQFAGSGLVTLCTDFGWRDGYVGELKGVMLAVEPSLTLTDLTHEIAPQAVAHGARVLRQACPRFPAGTVHLAVVDPGVGTARLPVVVFAGGQALVGPDNGLLAPAARALGGLATTRVISTHPWLLSGPSATFDGRDLFAPTAAALAAGLLGEGSLGAEVELTALAETRPAWDGVDLTAPIVHADRFGTLVTSATAADLRAAAPTAAWTVSLPDGTSARWVRTYGEAAPGELVVLWGSDGELELACRDRSAAEVTGLGPGDALRLTPRP